MNCLTVSESAISINSRKSQLVTDDDVAGGNDDSGAVVKVSVGPSAVWATVLSTKKVVEAVAGAALVYDVKFIGISGVVAGGPIFPVG